MWLDEMVFAHASRMIAAKRARNSINPCMHSQHHSHQHEKSVYGAILAGVVKFHGLFIKFVIWKYIRDA